MADVFVSYTTSDRDRVARLVEALQTAGLSVWWDRGIDVGSTFDREIERELDGAGCVVVVWSNASVDSEWVRNEAFEAQSRNALVPILIDDVKPPLAFRRAQTAKMIQWPTSAGEFDAMLRAIHGRLAKMPLPAELQPSQTHGASHTTADTNAPSIAVLPLSNVSPDPEQVHFVDGLTIELIHRLSRIPNLRVAGQASSFAYKNRPVSYAEVGRTLGVAHLLEGSVRRAGDQLRVTVELVSTANGFHLWSADFDRKLDDVFAIQREVSEAVADALSVKLRGDSLELLGSTSNASAHSHYLRGNALFLAAHARDNGALDCRMRSGGRDRSRFCASLGDTCTSLRFPIASTRADRTGPARYVERRGARIENRAAVVARALGKRLVFAFPPAVRRRGCGDDGMRPTGPQWSGVARRPRDHDLS